MGNEPRQLTVGTVINGYRVERELGRGAMAVVYLATQLDLERPVALKVLSAELAADAQFVARFFNESRAAASMSHPHIVQAYDAGIAEGGIYYFCMEYVDGETLLQRLNRQTRLDAQTCVALALDIADALNFGWLRQKFTHGDIKPENIMINSHEQAKLADFGLAKVEGHDYDGTDIMLTPLYAPPELIRGERGHKDCRSDIYAFGATLYHALAGTPPFPGDNAHVVLQRHLQDPLEPLRQRYSPTPPRFSDLVGRMLEKDPAKRPQTWGEVIEGLKKVQSDLLVLKAEDGPGVKKTKVMRADDGNGAVVSPLVTHRQWQSAKRTSHGVVTMLVLAVVLSLGTLVLKRHIEQQRPEDVQVEAAANSAVASSSQAGISGASAVTPEPEKANTGGVAVATSDRAAVIAATLPEADAGVAAATAAGTEAVKTPTGAEASHEPVVVPGGGGAGADEVAALVAPFVLRVPEVSIPMEMTERQKQVAAMIDAAWCLHAMRYDFNSAAPVEPLLKTVNEWLSSHEQTGDIGVLMLYLRDTALPALAEGKSQLVVNKAKVLGRTLTDTRERQFMVQDITYDQVEVQELTATGHIVRSMSWQEFFAEGLVDELFNEAFFAHETDSRQWCPYLAYLAFTKQTRALTSRLASYPQNEEGRLWRMVLVLMDMASGRKLDALKGWQELRLACRLGLSINAYRLASELRRSRNSISAAFADVLDALIQRCGESVPELRAADLMQQARQHLRLAPAEALNRCLLVKARYGVAAFPEKSTLEDIQKQALASLQAGMDGEKLDVWDAVPFGTLGRLDVSPQRSYIANVLLSRNKEIPPALRVVLPGLRPLSLLEMGDWFQASKLIEDKQVTALLQRPAMYRYPALFGRLLLVLRYGVDQSAADHEALMLTQMPIGSELYASLFAYAPEYALLSRRGDREFLYRFRTMRPGLDIKGSPEARRYLRYLDLCLCLEGAGRKDAMDALYAISDEEAGNAAGFTSEILRADAQRMHELIRLGSGPFYPPMIDTALPYLQLRLALACMGNRTLTGEGDETFMRLVESEGMRWPLSGGDMIYDWLLRRCAADIGTGDVAAAVARARWVLDLPYSCLFPYYGRLHLLLAGLHNLAGQSCGYLHAHAVLQVATVVSETERRLLLSVYERDGGRSLLAQLGYGHYGHFFVPWIEASHRLGRGETVDDLEQRFGTMSMPQAERGLAACLSTFQRERQAWAATKDKP